MFSRSEQVERSGLNKGELAAHLAVERSSVPEILQRTNLEPIRGIFQWRRILRCVHQVEGSLLESHLEALKDRYPENPSIKAITSLEEALMEPLMTFDQMAFQLRQKPDTLAKAIRQGRYVLPFPTLDLGPRLRRYRPLEVTLWAYDRVSLDLPKPANAPKQTISIKLASTGDETTLSKPSLFGRFALNQEA